MFLPQSSGDGTIKHQRLSQLRNIFASDLQLKTSMSIQGGCILLSICMSRSGALVTYLLFTSSDSISKSVENSERKLQDSWGRVREGSDDSAIADPSRIVVRSQKIAREIHVSLGPSNPQEVCASISLLQRNA